MKNKPTTWRKVRLGKVLLGHPKYGFTASAKDKPVGPKLLRITDIQGYVVDWNSVPYCEIENSEIKKYILEVGDILFARTGATTGMNYFVSKNPPENAVFASYLIRVRADDKKCDPQYLAYFFRSKIYWGQINGFLSGSAQPGINANLLTQLELSIPQNVNEQKRIAEILFAFDDKIELNNKTSKNLEQTAQAIFKEWFASPAEALAKEGRLPKGWEVKRLGEIADIQWGDTTKTKASYKTIGYPAYSASGADGFLDYFDFDKTGVVVSAIGANCGVTWLALNKWSCIKNTIRFWSKSERTSTEYLFLATNNKAIWPKRGSAQPFITLGDARNVKIIAPPTDLMDKVRNYFEKVFFYIERNKLENQKLAALRDLLLPKLISGEITIKN